MKSTGINLQILDKNGMRKLSFQEVPATLLSFSNLQVDMDFLQAKNVFLSGEFCPMDENTFIERLRERKANVQQEITPETEILICGQYPDWVLVEEARHYGIKIVFFDKAGEFFSRMAAKLINNKTSSPVGEPMDV